MPTFFIPLGFKYGSYWHLGSVHGPYDNIEAAQTTIDTKWPNSKTDEFLIFEGQLAKVRLSSLEKPESEKRKPGNPENYVQAGEGYKCKTCNADILGAQVAHPVWVRGFTGGGGECRYETVPYCPNCETKPNSHGSPVYEDELVA